MAGTASKDGARALRKSEGVATKTGEEPPAGDAASKAAAAAGAGAGEGSLEAEALGATSALAATEIGRAGADGLPGTPGPGSPGTAASAAQAGAGEVPELKRRRRSGWDSAPAPGLTAAPDTEAAAPPAPLPPLGQPMLQGPAQEAPVITRSPPAPVASPLVDAGAVLAAEQVALTAAMMREAQLQHEPVQKAALTPSCTVKVDQRWVGFVIGQGGENLKHIRDVTGVSIQIDQAMKDKGYSIVQVFGPKEGADRAVLMVEAKLAEVDPTRQLQGEIEEIKVDQGLVGYMLGKGGETLRAIKLESGAAITIDQGTKDLGYSILRIVGEEHAKKAARDLVNNRIAEVKGAQPVAYEFKLEQSFVGWLIGRGGETVKNIKDQSGAGVVIDQATKDLGYSMVRVLPGPGADLAKSLIEAKLREVEAMASSVEEIPVEQKVVGWLIGRGGETVRQIKDQSGATMVINQNTKDAGYSTVRLGGSPEAIARARAIVMRKIAEVHTMSRCNDEHVPLTAAQLNAAGLKVMNGSAACRPNVVPLLHEGKTPTGARAAPQAQAYDPFAADTGAESLVETKGSVIGLPESEAYDPFAE